MSVSRSLLDALDAYLKARGFGSRTHIVEAALAEFLEGKGCKIEPTTDEMLVAIAKTRLQESDKPKPKKGAK